MSDSAPDIIFVAQIAFKFVNNALLTMGASSLLEQEFDQLGFNLNTNVGAQDLHLLLDKVS